MSLRSDGKYDLTRFGHRLAFAIQLEGFINRKEFGDRLGLEKSQVSLYVNGKVIPRADTLAAMLAIMPNTDARWLICGGKPAIEPPGPLA